MSYQNNTQQSTPESDSKPPTQVSQQTKVFALRSVSEIETTTQVYTNTTKLSDLIYKKLIELSKFILEQIPEVIDALEEERKMRMLIDIFKKESVTRECIIKALESAGKEIELECLPQVMWTKDRLPEDTVFDFLLRHYGTWDDMVSKGIYLSNVRLKDPTFIKTINANCSAGESAKSYIPAYNEKLKHFLSTTNYKNITKKEADRLYLARKKAKTNAN